MELDEKIGLVLIYQYDSLSVNLFFLKLDKIFYQTNIEASATILIQYFNLNLSNR